jgi:hypothetical protein
MSLQNFRNTRFVLALAGLFAVVWLQLCPYMSYAQNLGQQPAVGQAVQGENAAQPEGTFLNLVNWVGNVIAPVGAAVAYSQGRGVGRWVVTAVGLILISGVTRLIEFWIANGRGSSVDADSLGMLGQ